MEKIHALLVEDNLLDVRLVREAVADKAQTELKLSHADCLKQALTKLAEEHFDVILLDLSLPDSIGFETLNQVHKQAPQIPIVILTGTDDEAMANKSLKLGAQDYLVKGQVDGQLLLRSLRYAIERAHTSDALRTSEAMFRELTDNIEEIFWVRELNGDLIYINPAYERIWGLTCESLYLDNESFISLVHPDDLEMVKRRVADRLNGESFDTEYRIIRPDGALRWIYGRILTIKNIEGKIYRIAGVLEDITDRKLAEQRQSAQFHITEAAATCEILEDFLEVTHIQLATLMQTENFVVALNSPVKEDYIFPYMKDERGATNEDAVKFYTGLADYVCQTQTPVIIRKSSFEKIEQIIGTKFEGHVPEICIAAPLRIAGRVIGMVAAKSYKDNESYHDKDLEMLTFVAEHTAIAVDRKRTIEELRKSEDQLRQSQKMEAIGRLAGGVAHDFNNLLTAILGHADLASLLLREGDTLAESIDEIKKAANRAASLTRQLLAFSRGQVLQPKLLDLNSIISDTQKMLRRLIGEDVDLVSVLEPVLGYVKADPGQIEQVLMNLAVNARDAMPRGGKLTIITANSELSVSPAEDAIGFYPGRYVVLAISDSGTGIDPEILPHIYEPFFSTKERGKGTGLGLSMVYGIVKQSGGFITCDSKKGKGTTFRIFLPMVNEEIVVTKLSKRDEIIGRGSETILIAEDEEVIRELIRRTLSQRGYTVIESRNGREALEVAQNYEDDIHLLITDIVMPHVSGIELVEKITLKRPTIKCLLMSGHTEDAITSHGYVDTNNGFLQKPFLLDALIRKVREILDSPAFAEKS